VKSPREQTKPNTKGVPNADPYHKLSGGGGVFERNGRNLGMGKLGRGLGVKAKLNYRL